MYLVESKSTGKTFAVKAFAKEGVSQSNKGNAKVMRDCRKSVVNSPFSLGNNVE